MEGELDEALREICSDFQDYFEEEIPSTGMQRIEWVKEILDITKQVVESAKEAPESQSTMEHLLQKTEKEIRSHVRIEQQLKLHIDSLQQRVEDYEKRYPQNPEEYKLAIAKEKAENDKLKKQVLGLDCQSSPKQDYKKEHKTRKAGETETKYGQIEQLANQRAKKISALEEENTKIRKEIEEKKSKTSKMKSAVQKVQLELKKYSKSNMMNTSHEVNSSNAQRPRSASRNTQKKSSAQHSLQTSREISKKDTYSLEQHRQQIQRKILNYSSVLKSERSASVKRPVSRGSDREHNKSNTLATGVSRMRPQSAYNSARDRYNKTQKL